MNRVEEISAKRELLRSRLSELGLDGAVISSQAAFSWYTAGGENRVATATEIGAASIVVTPTIDYIVTNNIEGPRVSAEAVPAQSGFQIVETPWHEQMTAEGTTYGWRPKQPKRNKQRGP